MSEQRDELQGVIDRHAIDELDDFHGSATCSCGMEMDESEHPAHVTDELLAAGYRKPHTITTVEELDALPDGSAIIDGEGDVGQKLSSRWHFPETAPMGSSKVIKYGPVTVLHEPTP